MGEEWETVLDPTTERWYYYNVHTQESQWAEDVFYPQLQLQQVGGEGEAHTQHTQHTQHNTQYVQHTQPLPDSDYSDYSDYHDYSESSESSFSLPAHITAAFDDTAQSWYYVNQWTGVSTWEYHPEQLQPQLQPQELQPQQLQQPPQPSFTTPAEEPQEPQEPQEPRPSPIVMTTRVSVLQHPSSSVGVTTLYPEPMMEGCAGWAPIFDEDSGSYYYQHETTGETSWDPSPATVYPVMGASVMDASVVDVSVASVEASTPIPGVVVESGNVWEAVWDETNQAYYYFNSETGDTSW